MTPLKPFTFRPPSMYTLFEPDSEREEIIEYKGESVGYIAQYPTQTYGKANVRVTLHVWLYGIRVRHTFRNNRFYTIQEAEQWLLSKQLAIFDTYVLLKAE